MIAALTACATNSGQDEDEERGKELEYAQATGHVVKSHSTGIIMRPFSSLFRLVYVSINPAPINGM